MVLHQNVDIDEFDDNQRVLKEEGPGEESKQFTDTIGLDSFPLNSAS
jgi:hypothetical protein